MYIKKFAVACLSLCLCAQPVFSSYAGTIVAGSGASIASPSNVSPATGSSSASSFIADQAWHKINGQYVDASGNPIDGVLMRGISVSKWQGNIDWAKVASDDISFAFVRMVSYGYEGQITMDETFDQNMRQASAHGIKTAPYIYLQTKTVEEARKAGQFAVDTARNYNVNFPIAVDIESPYILTLSVQELTDVINAFCQVIADNGYTPIVYSDFNKLSTEMDTSQIPYDIWLARYGSTNNQFANRTIWQPTETASVNGLSGNVCVELAFKNYIGQVGTGNGSSTSTVGPAGSQNHSVSATPTVGASSQTGGPGVQAGNGSLTSPTPENVSQSAPTTDTSSTTSSTVVTAGN